MLFGAMPILMSCPTKVSVYTVPQSGCSGFALMRCPGRVAGALIAEDSTQHLISCIAASDPTVMFSGMLKDIKRVQEPSSAWTN